MHHLKFNVEMTEIFNTKIRWCNPYINQSWARTLYPHTITYMYAHAHTNTSLLRALLTDETYFYILSKYYQEFIRKSTQLHLKP